MSENCKYEKELGALLEANKNFKEFMFDIKDNHLTSIYDKIDCIFKKLGNRRPSWLVTWIIASLTSLCGILIMALVMLLGKA